MPRVLLSCAITLDGYLNDMLSERLELSSPQDRDAIDALRAASDAVVIGRGTAIADDPSLTVRSAARQAARRLAGRTPQPVRVVLAGRQALPSGLRVLDDGQAQTLVYGTKSISGRNVEPVPSDPRDVTSVLRDLGSRGVERALIEGGEAVSTTVLRASLADAVRLAIAPAVVGRSRAPRIAGRLRSGAARWLKLQPVSAEFLGNTSVIYFSKEPDAGHGHFWPRSDAEWLAEAIELARWCPPSSHAYSVGAWLTDADGVPISYGFSRELDAHVHAEESALRKAVLAGRNLTGATVYSSMEPCSRRLSGRTSCCERIIGAGISRVVFAQREPLNFVQCDGIATLRRAGVAVLEVPELAEFAAAANLHLGHSESETR